MDKPITEGTERQFILRLPQDVAGKVHEAIREDELTERLQISDFSDVREGLLHFDDITLSAKLMDLPCIIESHKTLDKKSLYKTGDICQIMICSHTDDGGDETERPHKKDHYKRYQLNHGITPPLKNVRKRRFRKTARKNKLLESPEVEKEVKRLIREDLAAINVDFKLVKQDEAPNTPSMASADVSRCQTPASSQKELMDTRNQVNPELLKILEEASSDSSGSVSDFDV
ncbi:transcription initiation factor TFIID subunit 7-like [Dysidea avara]|uniref:transcription initiation factor TFIID subunit 7-like n=1 Tax=Dysidea avara TaxID=196820 RepID=UPI0033345FB0